MKGQVKRRKARVQVSGEMTIYTAAALKEPLLAQLEKAGGGAQLDLSEVSEFDTAGLQLVLLAVRHLTGGAGTLKVLEPSPAVSEVLELCGLERLTAAPP